MGTRILLLATAMVVSSTLQAGGGPFDYTNPVDVQKHLEITERYHFNNDVRTLRRGMTGSVRADLTYVLRRFPNHHPALDAMARLWRKYMKRGEIPPGEGLDPSHTAEYWFERAMKFAPHDGMVRLLYGIHKHKLGKYKEALALYKQAEEIMPDSADVHYDLGLLYFDLGDYEQAYRHALKAYRLGYPLPGLKRKLVRQGIWKTGQKSGEKAPDASTKQ